MKTRTVVILVVQSILIVLALLYAFVQSSIATEKEKQAIMAQQQALRNADEAHKTTVEYMRKVEELEEALQNCQKK